MMTWMYIDDGYDASDNDHGVYENGYNDAEIWNVVDGHNDGDGDNRLNWLMNTDGDETDGVCDDVNENAVSEIHQRRKMKMPKKMMTVRVDAFDQQAKEYGAGQSLNGSAIHDHVAEMVTVP